MANPKGNPQNFKPVRTKDEARKRGSNGGKKSGEVRAYKKNFKDTLKANLTQDAMKEMALAMIKEAKKGNTKAYEILRDTMGENPKLYIDNAVSGEMIFKWQS